jgi:serine protease Do
MATVMDEITLLNAIERYIRGEMNPDERVYFENLRKTNAEIDQQVVEHTLLMQQMNRFGEWKKFKSLINDTHTHLAEQGKINFAKLKGKAKVVYLWKRYKRVAAIAAIIAGVTTLTISALVWSLSPQPDSKRLIDLGRQLEEVKKDARAQRNEVNNLKGQITPATPKNNIEFKSGGTGFLVDGSGLLVTNAHIIRISKNIAVFNNKGEEFRAIVVKRDNARDIAILKIVDPNFKPLNALPYGISKGNNEVGEPVFTLGYPRNDIVYSEGYLSAPSGFNGDTLSCQLGMAANRGNSGGPVFNHDGEVIGMLSTKETEADGVAFAIRSKFIYEAIASLKKDTTYQNVKLVARSSVRGLEKKEQVKKIQDYVFMVKGD